MIILEKNVPLGVSRIELPEKMMINANGLSSIEGNEYLNNNLESHIQIATTDASISSIVDSYKKRGYVVVRKAETLKADPSSSNVRKLSLKEFQKEYPQIYLNNFRLNANYNFEVHTEDEAIDGDLDLSSGDFLDEPTHLIFLKSLTVNGSVYSSDIDTDEELRDQPVYFESKKKTWINVDAFKIPEIQPFLKDKKIIKSLKNNIDFLKKCNLLDIE